MSTGFVSDRRFLDHDTGRGHPEQPARLTAALDSIAQQSWREELRDIAAQPADLEWLRTTHSAEYIERARLACNQGQPFLDSMDVAISHRSFNVARLAAGAPLGLADAIMSGQIDNGFALVRPPGHHAENDSALGFCLFNNVAIVTRYLQNVHGLERIAVLDWDVHHGNGTQHTFEADPSVMYLSTHQYPYYPGTGAYSEQGIGKGKGSIVNCPMQAGADDDDYVAAFRERILPALDTFKPDAIIISAGFDAHIDDPLAEIALSTNFFGWMTDRVLEIADRHAHGRIISVLEGGYNLATLGGCIAIHLERMLALDNG